jgi:hypothetical protein
MARAMLPAMHATAFRDNQSGVAARVADAEAAWRAQVDRVIARGVPQVMARRRLRVAYGRALFLTWLTAIAGGILAVLLLMVRRDWAPEVGLVSLFLAWGAPLVAGLWAVWSSLRLRRRLLGRLLAVGAGVTDASERAALLEREQAHALATQAPPGHEMTGMRWSVTGAIATLMWAQVIIAAIVVHPKHAAVALFLGLLGLVASAGVVGALASRVAEDRLDARIGPLTILAVLVPAVLLALGVGIYHLQVMIIAAALTRLHWVGLARRLRHERAVLDPSAAPVAAPAGSMAALAGRALAMREARIAFGLATFVISVTGAFMTTGETSRLAGCVALIVAPLVGALAGWITFNRTVVTAGEMLRTDGAAAELAARGQRREGASVTLAILSGLPIAGMVAGAMLLLLPELLVATPWLVIGTSLAGVLGAIALSEDVRHNRVRQRWMYLALGALVAGAAMPVHGSLGPFPAIFPALAVLPVAVLGLLIGVGWSVALVPRLHAERAALAALLKC